MSKDVCDLPNIIQLRVAGWSLNKFGILNKETSIEMGSFIRE